MAMKTLNAQTRLTISVADTNAEKLQAFEDQVRAIVSSQAISLFSKRGHLANVERNMLTLTIELEHPDLPADWSQAHDLACRAIKAAATKTGVIILGSGARK